jgi:hypothetical protein
VSRRLESLQQCASVTVRKYAHTSQSLLRVGTMGIVFNIHRTDPGTMSYEALSKCPSGSTHCDCCSLAFTATWDRSDHCTMSVELRHLPCRLQGEYQALIRLCKERLAMPTLCLCCDAMVVIQNKQSKFPSTAPHLPRPLQSLLCLCPCPPLLAALQSLCAVCCFRLHLRCQSSSLSFLPTR